MSTDSHKKPKYKFRIPAETMAKIKLIAEYHGRSTNREIEQLILRCIDEFEKENGEIPTK